DGIPVPQTTDLSYFARMTDADTFGRLATLETHRRGTETAGTVAAVMDGAVWQQGVVDLLRPDAVRIRDFPHAAEHMGLPAALVHGRDTPATRCWRDAVLHALRHGDPAAVLEAVATLPTTAVAAPGAAAVAVAATVEYLAGRWD